MAFTKPVTTDHQAADVFVVATHSHRGSCNDPDYIPLQFLYAHLSLVPLNILISESLGKRIDNGRLQAFPGKYRHLFDARPIYRTGDMASGNIRSKSGGPPRMSRTKLSYMQSPPVLNIRYDAQQEISIQTNAGGTCSILSTMSDTSGSC